MTIPLSRVLPGFRTAFRRRGPGYAWHLVREHLVPRTTYNLFCSPWGSVATLPVARAAWTAVDALSGSRSERRLMARTRTLGPGIATLVGNPGAGSALTDRKLTQDRARALERLITELHRAGITGLRHSLDQLVVTPSGSLAFRRLRGARLGRANGLRFQVERDLDRRAVNRRYGLSLLTEAGVRREMRAQRARLPRGWFRDYAPIDFGGGVSVGLFPSTDSGTGRWDFLNGQVVGPLVKGRRVLDLGSNNGSLPLMMLRAGAREVVAVEQSDTLAGAMRLYHRILEWRDMREYALTVRVGDMRELLMQDWSAFDVVTAFCSIYYLPAEDMARVVRKAAAAGATLVLQANEGAVKNPAAQPGALRALVRENGYGEAAVHNRDGFARPLLVAVPAAESRHSPSLSA